MLELSLLNKEKYRTRRGDKIVITKTDEIIIFLVYVAYIILVIMAVNRALKCSDPTPDSRAIHFLFCLTSPISYLLISHVVPGFCKT